MSSSHHDDHYSAEEKPVSFTVPFILAAVTLVIIFLFVSVCDPKHGHHAEGHGHDAAMEASQNHEATMDETHQSAVEEPAMKDSAKIAPGIAPDVEGKPTPIEEATGHN